MQHHQFSRTVDIDFSTTLNQRVNAYFKSNQLSKHANNGMYIKSLAMLSFYLVPFILILSIPQMPFALLLTLWLCMGLGKALIGTSVMHDTLHGSYTKNGLANWLLHLPVFIIGVDPFVWKLQHNVLHHSYTNVEHADEDIGSRYIFRFTPNQPRRWFHAAQHFYAPIFYSLLTVIWVVAKDYIKLIGYRNAGLITDNKLFWSRLSIIIASKTLYLALTLGLPLLVLPYSTLAIVGMYISMHLVAGLTLSLIFQPAHVMETSSFNDGSALRIEENALVHQIKTTCNFAPNNKLLTWAIGGLNFQIEHHLFPHVCHVHYPALSKIVKSTAEEFGIAYNTQKSFRSALWAHFRMLYLLGNKDVIMDPVR